MSFAGRGSLALAPLRAVSLWLSLRSDASAACAGNHFIRTFLSCSLAARNTRSASLQIWPLAKFRTARLESLDRVAVCIGDGHLPYFFCSGAYHARYHPRGTG